MIVLDKELVQKVKWADDPDTYDIRLHALGKAYDNFIVINTDFDKWVLDYFDSSYESTKCVMWVRGDKWLAKKFNKTWTPDQGWEIIEVKIESIKTDHIIVEKNLDLPDLFDVPDFQIPIDDLDTEFVWYLDRNYFANDDVWVYKIRMCKHPFKTQNMGVVRPSIADRLDVIFISYDEENAEENWKKVLNIAPYAQRVHGVKGIFEAHKAAAELSQTDMFWVVDGDAEILPSWNFSFQPNIFNRDCVHVWNSVNPINGLTYGYGGVKLFPRKLVNSATTWKVDMTTSLGNKLKVIDSTSNLTAFNTSPFATWRSSFRECAKLSAGTINNHISEENKERLHAWMTIGANKRYGKYAIAGALSGAKYGSQNFNSLENLKLINNREWLFEVFKNEKI
jgi:hypothetical protein